MGAEKNRSLGIQKEFLELKCKISTGPTNRNISQQIATFSLQIARLDFCFFWFFSTIFFPRLTILRFLWIGASKAAAGSLEMDAGHPVSWKPVFSTRFGQKCWNLEYQFVHGEFNVYIMFAISCGFLEMKKHNLFHQTRLLGWLIWGCHVGSLNIPFKDLAGFHQEIVLVHGDLNVYIMFAISNWMPSGMWVSGTEPTQKRNRWEILGMSCWIPENRFLEVKQDSTKKLFWFMESKLYTLCLQSQIGCRNLFHDT